MSYAITALRNGASWASNTFYGQSKMENKSERYENAGAPWMETDEQQMLAMFNGGCTAPTIAANLGRTVGSICTRLERLGRLKNLGGDYYPVSATPFCTRQAVNTDNDAHQQARKGWSGPELTVEQLAALRSYAHRYGRAWKSALKAAWATGRDQVEPEGVYLRQVRNNLGPQWLTQFKFPKE